MPERYIIIKPAFDICGNSKVVFYNSSKQTEETLFTGKRWCARRFVRDLRKSEDLASVPVFNETQRTRNGRVKCVEIPLGKL